MNSMNVTSSSSVSPAPPTHISASSLALLLICYQNDYTKKQGILHHTVQDVMEQTQMLWNTAEVVHKLRKQACTIIHVPVYINQEGIAGSDKDEDAVVGDSSQEPSQVRDDDPIIGRLVEAKAFAPSSFGSQFSEEVDIDSTSLLCIVFWLYKH